VGEPVVGDVVVVSFPFSDLSGSKRRPALIVALGEFDDIILSQITSRAYSSSSAIPLDSESFANGGLDHTSYLRPDNLFTASGSIILRTVGTLKPEERMRIGGRIAAQFMPS
jgi:mRNA interferase MazF